MKQPRLIKLFTILLLSTLATAAWAQEEPILLDMTASDKIMPIPDTTEGYAVIFYTYKLEDKLFVRTARLTADGVKSERNIVAEDVVRNSGEIIYFKPFEDVPANWHATWHRALKQYLLVYATEDGIFARRVRENGAARGGPKKIMANESIDNLIVVQSGAKNYILFYKQGLTTYAQLLRKTGAAIGKPKAIAGGFYFGDTVPLEAFCDSKTNAVLFYGTYTQFSDEYRFSAGMFRTNKSLNPIAHQAFNSIAETKDFGGILAASSPEEEMFMAMWPTKSWSIETGDIDDPFGRRSYGAIANEDGQRFTFEGPISANIEMLGLATNPLTDNYWLIYAVRNGDAGDILLNRIYVTNEGRTGGQETISTLSNKIYGVGYGITLFGAHLVCYSYEEDTGDSGKKEKTYLQMLN